MDLHPDQTQAEFRAEEKRGVALDDKVLNDETGWAPA
jgi:hypothetical protein